MNLKLGIAGRMAAAFVNSKLTPLLIVTSLLLGAMAVLKTPREEEPQIIVPMADVITAMPGATSRDVERRITVPLEQRIAEIPGVEYVYSTSSPGQSMIVVRFRVGQDPERAMVRLRDKVGATRDRLPGDVRDPQILPRSIDDVPILALTLHSSVTNDAGLRQIAARVADTIKGVPEVAEATLIGGATRQLHITLDPARLAAQGLSIDAVAQALAGANQRSLAGGFDRDGQRITVESGDSFRTLEDLQSQVVGQIEGRSIRLRDVALITSATEEDGPLVRFAEGPAHEKTGLEVGPSESLRDGAMENAVTISVAKRPGTNAVGVSHAAIQRLESLKGNLIPDDVTVTVTRDYGESANEKSQELLYHMGIAVISVTLLIAWVLGRKEALVVLVAIPVTLALTLLVFYLYGYTLNRITLFALIFSIGILVDDAIVVVENIVRHYRLPHEGPRDPIHTAVYAVDEVGNPTILATFTVIAAILPMAFVGGLMGPYMRPIPVGATAAMLFSLAVAFMVTPWAAVRLLKHDGPANGHGEADDKTTRLYRKFMTPLLHRPAARWGFFGGIGLLLLAAIALVPLGFVIVKMLPFDNKSEFQLIVDMPTGSTRAQTSAATQALAEYMVKVPEVANVQTHVGTAGPYNFNGLVRHYFFRQGTNQADIQVNLAPKGERKAQSHAIAKRIRPDLERIARDYGVRLKIAEVPPGPPVLQTLVAEVYGPDAATRLHVAQQVKKVFSTTEGVADIDWYVDDPQSTLNFRVDEAKAALVGVDVASINRTIGRALTGQSIGVLQDPEAREAVPIILRLDRTNRSGTDRLLDQTVRSSLGAAVPLRELVQAVPVPADGSIYRKNLQSVIYVTGDVAGRKESPVYAILKMNQALAKIALPAGARLNVLTTHLPEDDQPAVKWDGEWYITYEVFRDLGIAFAAVLVLILILVVAWFQSFRAPIAIMAPIPLTLVGILPAHALMGAFFTATSMIGFIAGAGIIVRNSIILVDFIELRRREGVPLAEAVIDAGATRFRPMLLTAAAVIVGTSVILFDPIFQGLAISLMAGEIASTLLSRIAVPVLYYMLENRQLVTAAQADANA